MQKAFIFDIDRCTGCQACQIACSIENEVAPDISWRQITTFNPRHQPGLPSFHLSLACNHCVDPPCMKSCPAAAYSKDTHTGAVTIDPASCIGCKYCAWACPYDAPQFNRRAGVMEKCTFCAHRLAEGSAPACVESCPTGALRFADLDGSPGDTRVAGFPDVDVEPAIRFVKPRGERRVPDVSLPPTAPDVRTAHSAVAKISLASEWSLILFSLLAATLVAWILSARAVDRGAFWLLGAAALLASTLHLGKKRRAYRAILNWRSSWLSREIICFSAFLGVSSLHLLLAQAHTSLFLASIACGLAALVCMDNVYRVTGTPRLRAHSAQVLLIGIFLAALFAGDPVLYLVIGGVRLVLYLVRKSRLAIAGSPPRWALGGIRVMVGMALPLAWIIDPAGPAWLPVACVFAGELIDRAEFYLELQVPTPRRQALLDLDAMVRRRAAESTAGD